MKKSPNMKENIKTINNSKFTYLSKSKQKTSSLEKTTYSNRSLIGDAQTPNQPKKNISTQASDQKLRNPSQILKSLMKIQTRTNPVLAQQNSYAGIKLNFNNCVDNQCSKNKGDQKSITQYNSLNQTVHPSPKTKAISLSTYSSTQSPELREREVKQEKLGSFKQLLIQTKECLENVRISEMKKRIEKTFNDTIEPLLQLKTEIMKQIEKCIGAESFQIKTTIDSLKKMEDDILSNEFNIIEYMEMGPFNEIMSIYQKKFKEHSIFTQQLAQQDMVVNQLGQLHESFNSQNQQMCKQLSTSLQSYLSLYISFQNKDDFYELKQNTNQINQITSNFQTDNLFQTCETNNSIDEDQVIIRDQQTVRIPEKTQQFTNLLRLNSQKILFPSESPQFKN